MWNFITKLFDTEDFPPRWNCGNWDDFLGWLHIISDITIWLAYMAIPCMLFYFVTKKKEKLPFNYIFLLFCSFIFWCGTGHLIEATMFWFPLYRVSGLIKCITAVVSVLTAFALFKVIPSALELKTPDELKDLVYKRTQELNELSQKLKRSNEELEQFAYVASHDLQEPLRMVSQNTSRLEKHLGDNIDEKSHKYLSFASDGARRMQILIEDLLDFSRVRRNIAEDFKEVDLNKILTAVKLDLDQKIQDCHAHIHAPILPTIKGDETQLYRLFQNLITNAIKYRRQDEPLRINIDVTDDIKYWLLEFRDNGIGFAPDQAERIFSLFQRLHPHSKYPGTGMGLSICKTIVELHGGQIWAKGREDEGACFYVRLPK